MADTGVGGSIEPMTDQEQSQPAGSPTADTAPVGTVTADGEVVTSQSDGDDNGRLLSWTLLSKVWAVVVAAGLGFGATVLSTLLVLGLFVALGSLSIPRPSSPLVRFGIQFFFGQLVVMGGLSAVYLWATGNTIDYLNIHRPTLTQLAVIVVGPFAVYTINIVVNVAGISAGLRPAPNVLAQIVSNDPSLVIPLIPAMLLIVGPFEELLYRGVIQTRLRQSFTPAVAIIITSVIFALIHIPALGGRTTAIPSILLTLAALFGGSLVFGGIYEWTANLTVVALIHGLYNSMLLGLLYIATRYADEIRELAEQATALPIA